MRDSLNGVKGTQLVFKVAPVEGRAAFREVWWCLRACTVELRCWV